MPLSLTTRFRILAQTTTVHLTAPADTSAVGKSSTLNSLLPLHQKLLTSNKDYDVRNKSNNPNVRRVTVMAIKVREKAKKFVNTENVSAVCCQCKFVMTKWRVSVLLWICVSFRRWLLLYSLLIFLDFFCSQSCTCTYTHVRARNFPLLPPHTGNMVTKQPSIQRFLFHVHGL